MAANGVSGRVERSQVSLVQLHVDVVFRQDGGVLFFDALLLTDVLVADVFPFGRLRVLGLSTELAPFRGTAGVLAGVGETLDLEALGGGQEGIELGLFDVDLASVHVAEKQKNVRNFQKNTMINRLN